MYYYYYYYIIIIMLKIKLGFKISQLEERESQSSNASDSGSLRKTLITSHSEFTKEGTWQHSVEE